MPKPSKSIPDRWLDYKPVGDIIDGTRFIAFKVPLKEELNKFLPDNQRFTPRDLLDKVRDLGLIIDLTNTTRYYDPKAFEAESITYMKIFCEGHKIPKQQVVKNFCDAVDTFLEKHSTGLIGVHCTHGLNRTGYLICRYLIESMKMEPENAIKAFEDARGHKIEREIYVQDLKKLPPLQNKNDLKEETQINNYNEYLEENNNRVAENQGPHWQGSRWETFSPLSLNDGDWYQESDHKPGHFLKGQSPFPPPYHNRKGSFDKAEKGAYSASREEAYSRGRYPPGNHAANEEFQPSHWNNRWRNNSSWNYTYRPGPHFKNNYTQNHHFNRPHRGYNGSPFRPHPYAPQSRGSKASSWSSYDRSRIQPEVTVEMPKSNQFFDLPI